MFKYDMIIDNETYKALFTDHMDAADFIDEIATESEIIVLGFTEVTIADIINDNDFEYDYKVEMIALIVAPDNTFEKWMQAEEFLKNQKIL